MDWDELSRKMKEISDANELSKTSEALEEIYLKRQEYKKQMHEHEHELEEIRKRTAEMIWTGQLEQMDINHLKNSYARKNWKN